MKKKILNKLRLIKNLAINTGMTGRVELHFTGILEAEWDEIVESIKKYPRYKHNFSITDKLTVSLILD